MLGIRLFESRMPPQFATKIKQQYINGSWVITDISYQDMTKYERNNTNLCEDKNESSTSDNRDNT